MEVLKRIEAAANAAAVSPAKSEPGLDVVRANAGLAIVMSSGLPHHAWSRSPSPTYKREIISQQTTTLSQLVHFLLAIYVFILILLVT